MSDFNGQSFYIVHDLGTHSTKLIMKRKFKQ